MLAKQIIGHFFEFFEGALTFFVPSKWPIMCFVRIKNNLQRPYRYSGTFIVKKYLIKGLPGKGDELKVLL
jgi:hypothetical protein